MSSKAAPVVAPKDPSDFEALIPLDLLEALNRRYPEASAEPGQSLDEIMFYGGKRDLIRWLRHKYDEQQGNNQNDNEDE